MGPTFIDNIPGIAFPLVMSNDIGDVVLHSRNKSFIGPGAAGDYSRSAHI